MLETTELVGLVAPHKLMLQEIKTVSSVLYPTPATWNSKHYSNPLRATLQGEYVWIDLCVMMQIDSIIASSVVREDLKKIVRDSLTLLRNHAKVVFQEYQDQKLVLQDNLSIWVDAHWKWMCRRQVRQVLSLVGFKEWRTNSPDNRATLCKTHASCMHEAGKLSVLKSTHAFKTLFLPSPWHVYRVQVIFRPLRQAIQ